MGIIDELKSFFRAGSEISDKFDKFNTRSVARSASEQSFIYPCLMDSTIPVDMAGTLSQHLDRTYASWTQIYLSSIGLIDLNYIRNPKQFVARYQPKWLVMENADDEEDLETCMEELKDLAYGDEEMFFVGECGDATVYALFTPLSGATSTMRDQIRKLTGDPLMMYNQKPLGRSIMYEAPGDDPYDDVQRVLASQRASAERRDTAAMLKATEPRGPKLTDSDVKKINDMQPYTLELKLLATKGDTSFSKWVNFTVGVKTHMHLCDTDRLTASIIDVLRNRNPLFNFIRWTTGEISFMKDLILHLDDINFDVASKSDRTGRLISALKDLKKRYVNVNLTGVNKLAPFATIAISSNTYHEIKDNYGYDLKNMTFAKKVMRELFLMCFIIIDDAQHTYDILVDGQYDFQTYSLETIEREVSMKSSKLSKELTRMLGSN